MSPSSGWYPDPAGTADLRFWDGQTWTQQTAISPGALVTAPAPPAIPHQPRPPLGEQPYLPHRALPGSLAGSAPRPGAAHRRHGAVRVSNFYALVAGAAAVAVAAGVAIPLTMSKSSHHNKTTAEQPMTRLPSAAAPTPHVVVPTPAPAAPNTSGTTNASSYRLPAQFDGYPRITDARATEAEAEITRDWPLGGTHVIGIYGGPTGDPKAMALFQTVSLTTAGDAEILSGAEQGLNSDIPGLIFHATPTGSYGGEMQCATITEGTGGAVCVFADATTFGFTFVLGDPSTAQAQAAELRATTETAGPGPTI